MDALRFRLEKMTIEDFTKRAEGGHEDEAIGNGRILHYTRRSPEDVDTVTDRFGWVRLVDPDGGGGFGWQPIKRARISNEELVQSAALEGTPFEWGGDPSGSKGTVRGRSTLPSRRSSTSSTWSAPLGGRRARGAPVGRERRGAPGARQGPQHPTTPRRCGQLLHG
ncbi:MAG: hypothetical protein ACRD03_04595 [Acidimicrobiales bacterium]